MEKAHDVVIIGGGVIGLASALALMEADRTVMVLEARSVGSGSSHGNCGTVTPSHAPPLSAPGTIGKALKWMLTPDAPFYVKPRLDPALWHWLMRFASRCNTRDWQKAMVARASILEASRAAMPEWIARHGIDCEFDESGVDYVFRNDSKLERIARELPYLADLGIASHIISGDDYLRSEPALREGVVGAIHFPGDAHLRPDRFVAGLADAVRSMGGSIVERCEVLGIDASESGVSVATSQGGMRARDVVIATGAWSPLLAKSSGLMRLPIQPGKGYSITYDRPALAPRRPMVLHEHSVCVTTWGSGYRLGSTMEFSGYDTSLNRSRLDALERGAAIYLHEPVGPVKREEWFGWRPVCVDDVPIIGRLPLQQHVWVSAGHGMLGISMSTGSARLLADLITGRAPQLDPTPFAAERFR